MPNTMSSVYTCGRMHKPRKNKLHVPSGRASVVAAVARIMKEELSNVACDRWFSRLDAELGSGTFHTADAVEKVSGCEAVPVPRAWMPAKPKLALALLDEFDRPQESHVVGANSKPKASVGIHRLTKMVARDAIKRLREEKAEWLKSCGELTSEQQEDAPKMVQTLARVAFDLLVYVHARGVELQRADGVDAAVFVLHGSDQTLCGRAMRGCGIVYCDTGRVLFTRALEHVREGLVNAQLV